MNKVDIKWGVQIVAFNEIDFLEATIRMFQPFVNKIVVSTGDKSWQGNIKNDGSVEKVVMPLIEEFENVHLIKGKWDTETKQRNEALKYLKECNFVFIVDADEMWSSGDINKTKEYISKRQGYNVFRGIWNTRFKNINWRVEPREPYRPIVVIRKGITFNKNREVESTPETAAILIPEKIALIEHFSYVRSDDYKIKEKIQTFSHANEIIGGIDMWYENIYLQSDLDSVNLHPTHPECYSSLMKDEVDLEILRFLKEYSPQLFKDE